jgi:hypothetical protein
MLSMSKHEGRGAQLHGSPLDKLGLRPTIRLMEGRLGSWALTIVRKNSNVHHVPKSSRQTPPALI